MSEKINPFDFYNDASFGKEDLTKSGIPISGYLPYLTNRAFSYHPDTIFYSNEMNIRGSCDKMLQYSYYLNAVPKRKRYNSKWHKNEVTEDMELVMEYYGVNRNIAKSYLKILKKEQIQEIRNRRYQGGARNK